MHVVDITKKRAIISLSNIYWLMLYTKMNVVSMRYELKLYVKYVLI